MSLLDVQYGACRSCSIFAPAGWLTPSRAYNCPPWTGIACGGPDHCQRHTAAERTGKGKQSVTSRVCPMSRPSSWPVTRAGSHSWQCFTSLRMTCPSSCTVLSRVSFACGVWTPLSRRATAGPAGQQMAQEGMRGCSHAASTLRVRAAPCSALRRQSSGARQEPFLGADAGLRSCLTISI